MKRTAYTEKLENLQKRIVYCRKCPRLVRWRETVAHEKTARFRDQVYWGKPVPGFGDPDARLLLVGLAPAAHGGNRTGRMFTGDRSGDWLYRALWKAGFANQPVSSSRSDGLKLNNCYITATARCAPPFNKLLRTEISRCRPYLLGELQVLGRVRVVIGLGKIGFDAAFDAFRSLKLTDMKHRPKFRHGAAYRLNENLILIGSFHPSQQNTFTGKLTERLFDRVFERARMLIAL